MAGSKGSKDQAREDKCETGQDADAEHVAHAQKERKDEEKLSYIAIQTSQGQLRQPRG